MAQYCFDTDKRELFAEAYLRGILAALLDFPRLKTRWDCIVAGQRIPRDLRGQVCCIGAGDDDAYGVLIVSAWFYGYLEIEQYTERDLFVWASAVRSVPFDEAISLARRILASGKGQAEIERIYTEFRALPPGQVIA